MVRSAKPSRNKETPQRATAQVIDSASPAVIERPNDYAWQAPDGHQGCGPF